MNLSQLGWNDRIAAQFAAISQENWQPARVVRWHGDLCIVDGDSGELTARASGKLKYETQELGEMPALGDWVAIEPDAEQGSARIHSRLPRFSKFSRKAAGKRTDEQVLAANINTVFVVAGLDHNLKVSRLERYLTLIWNSGADPVIVLNKADRCSDLASTVSAVEEVSRQVPVLVMSAMKGEGVNALNDYLGPGQTAAAVGSSGVGKSTLINRLLGKEVQATQEVRADDSRGRHTTTFGQLIALPAGGIYIDTPGLREVQLWGDESDVDDSFADIIELAKSCKFSDCKHESEPGCAVRAAIESGELDARRYDNFCRMQREMKRLSKRQQSKASGNSKRRFKDLSRSIRDHYKHDRSKW